MESIACSDSLSPTEERSYAPVALHDILSLTDDGFADRKLAYVNLRKTTNVLR